ncbi:MFS transporter [Sphingomonas sp.]|uniref:MFS transporter n=1 Tax=Sphingomonas sp. TaxID=28214 RepID=UPI003CC5775C
MAQLSRGEWRDGWPVVAAAAIGIGSGPGLFQNLSSLFTPGIMAEFGWSRGAIGTAAGLGLLGALAAPVLGRAADRAGVRAMIAGAMLLLAAAYAGFAAMTGRLWQYQALIVCLALTVPGTGALVYGKLIAARFGRHRGLALAAGTSGLSLTTLALPPLLAIVIARGGWRSGFLALALAVAAIALPAVLLLLRRAPTVLVRPGIAVTLPGMTGRTARRTPRFWALGGAAALVNLATVGLVTQMVPFGLDRGLTPGGAALLLTSYGAAQIVGRFTIGWLVDRFPAPRMAAATAIVSAAGFAGLQLHAPGLGLALLLVFAAGLMNGADSDVLPFLASRLFGLKAYGEVYGSLLILALFGTAAGVVGFGRLHDATGGDGAALAIAAAGMVVAALLFLTLGRAAAAAGGGHFASDPAASSLYADHE